ncbi:Methionine--tRNA ligase [Metamycoplasma arthritidis]|uniref:Methionine--tRNA ligase n=1 Tax=Metamycoplasma arthritidis (strain 158L3-1) TaxID=243272 RepID=B3PM80_META1|nr:methionine--tRNA ligase [Metamycoplasma arthritidis]ACF07132.1 methionyl-tRNA synthetase [Metamycoplasma arthritidis 158L3-1]VEU78658.1 Methionine--tRNA ligase [Metamycoplasma arthritidis]
METKKTFYISTPIYYPSGKLHIGHLLTTTLAWVYRNFKRNEGYDTFFVTGIDEHGQKIAQKAKLANLSDQAYADEQAKIFLELWDDLKIDYDFFSRTTSPKHEVIVKKVFDALLKKGFIYKGKYEGLYSVEDEEFLTKSQAFLINGEYYHPTSKHKLNVVSEESYFFKMSSFGPWIKDYFENNPDFVSSKATINEMLNNFINPGLEDLSVTRVSFDWGIKLDQYQDKKTHVIYVWLDALFNYLTALNFWEEDDENYQKFWVNGTERVHILGKEISRFHCIYWPIFLQALDLKLPTKEIVHSWIVTPEGKMSKSKGNVIDPLPLVKKYGIEEVKYFFSSQVNIDSDFAFSESLLINVLNADLANNFGNLVNRTIKMVNQSFKEGTTYQEKDLLALDKELYLKIEQLYQSYCEHFNNFYADKALKKAVELSSFLNEYIDRNEPWKLKDNLERLNVVLNTLLNGIYVVNYMLSVAFPIKSARINQFLCQTKLSKGLIFNFNKFDYKEVFVDNIVFPRINK